MVKQGEIVSKKILKGVETLKNCVASTLGPKGKNILINDGTNSFITNDGVTIAKSVTLDDEIENMASSIARQASIKTNDVAGDGTTTAIVLTHAILKEGYKYILSGYNPIFLRKGINKASKFVCETFKKLSTPLLTKEDVFKVASISAKDENIGSLIASAYEEVGKNGVILAEDGKNLETELIITKGMQFEKGFVSPYMANTEKSTCEFENALIFVTDKKISRFNEILPLLEKASKKASPLVIIADDFDNDTISALVLNKIRGVLKVCAIKAPDFGENKINTLKDICALTNTKLFSSTCDDITTLSIEELGNAKTIKIDSNKTIIVGCESENLNSYINKLNKQIENEINENIKQNLKLRYSKLTSGVAQIKVGGASEVEQKEMKLRLEDALEATKAALDEGIVCGGGLALIQAERKLAEYIETLDGEEKLGGKIILSSLSAPCKQIVANCGQEPNIILKTIRDNLHKKNFGYNAQNNCYCDMKKCGIIDPTKVTRTALTNAASVAASLLTTDCVIK